MCVFKVAPKYEKSVFPKGNAGPLAYINLYTKPKAPGPSAARRSFEVEPAHFPGTNKLMGVVVALSDVFSACQIHPKFTTYVPRHWSSNNVLDKCGRFIVNPHRHLETFQSVH